MNPHADVAAWSRPKAPCATRADGVHLRLAGVARLDDRDQPLTLQADPCNRVHPASAAGIAAARTVHEMDVVAGSWMPSPKMPHISPRHVAEVDPLTRSDPSSERLR